MIYDIWHILLFKSEIKVDRHIEQYLNTGIRPKSFRP